MMTNDKNIGSNPLESPCPRCAAAAGQPCREPSGARSKKPHAARNAFVSDTPETAAADVREDDFARAGKRISLRDSSICVIIRTSRFTTRRTVKSEDVTVEANDAKGGEQPDQEMVTVAKDLLDSPELRAIATFDHYTKLWFKSRSVPSPLLRSSAYMFAIDALEDMYAYLEQRAKDRQPLIEAFKAALPAHVKTAKEKLGPLFDRTEYPRAADVDALFTFEWQVVEIGTPDQKLRGVSQALFEKEKAKAELVWSSAVGQIEQALAAGMQDVVTHLAERLGGGDEKPKRFRESALRKVTDFLDAFAQRNIGGSEQLAGLVAKAKALTNGVDVKALKDDAKVRQQVVAGFADIKKSLDTMVEAKPSRAIAGADDEV